MVALCPECDAGIELILIENVTNYKTQLKQKTYLPITYKPSNLAFNSSLNLTSEERTYDEFYFLNNETKDPIWNEFSHTIEYDYAQREHKLKWDIKGTSISNTKNIIKYRRKTIWESPAYFGNWKTFIKFVNYIADSDVEDIILTERAYCIMTGQDQKAHNKIDIAKARLLIQCPY